CGRRDVVVVGVITDVERVSRSDAEFAQSAFQQEWFRLHSFDIGREQDDLEVAVKGFGGEFALGVDPLRVAGDGKAVTLAELGKSVVRTGIDAAVLGRGDPKLPRRLI